MPLMKGFPSKHRVKEEKEAIENSGTIIRKSYIKKRTRGYLGIRSIDTW